MTHFTVWIIIVHAFMMAMTMNGSKIDDSDMKWTEDYPSILQNEIEKAWSTGA